MPRPGGILTPASSTEIKGQDGKQQLSHVQTSFELPPSAFTSGRSSKPSSAEEKQSPTSVSPNVATFPMQASETVKSRRRSSAAAQKDTFALPPPPTRSRKIIQMKPPVQEELTEPNPPSTKTNGNSSASGKGAAAPATSKKKQPSATSSAGRKIARKTAHSLIERRRRSKMNKEFAVLKGLIPACHGEMHKLAILQASIEYVRYLEDCVQQLKAQHDAPEPEEFKLSVSSRGNYDQDEAEEAEDGSQEDVEMDGYETTTSPALAPSRSSDHYSVSPALTAQDGSKRQRQYSYSSVSTSGGGHRHSYSASSATTSPAFGPQQHQHQAASTFAYAPASTSASTSALTSPALNPQPEDHEATAALLMLNMDRRGTFSGGGSSVRGRGMSVKDLLSS